MDITKEYKLTSEMLVIDKKMIYEEMGYINHDVPEAIIEIVETLFSKYVPKLEIRAGYRLFNTTPVKSIRQKLIADNVEFNVKGIISSQMRGISTAAFYLCTVGKKLDDWSKEFYDSGDQLEGYILDIIGSHIAETTAEWLEEKVKEEVGVLNFGCTNRYSPGYCGWDVYEQHKLFSFFEPGFLGVSLKESGLMKPIKSTSGVIGIGPGVKKQDYLCETCSIAQCIKKNISLRESAQT